MIETIASAVLALYFTGVLLVGTAFATRALTSEDERGRFHAIRRQTGVRTVPLACMAAIALTIIALGWPYSLTKFMIERSRK